MLAAGRERGETIRFGSEPLGSHPMVGEVRHVGAMVDVDFVTDRETKEPSDPGLQVYERVYDAVLERGVYIYPGRASVDGVDGDHVMLAPPLDVSEASAERVGRTTVETVGEEVLSVEYDHRRRSGRTASEAPAGSGKADDARTADRVKRGRGP